MKCHARTCHCALVKVPNAPITSIPGFHSTGALLEEHKTWQVFDIVWWQEALDALFFFNGNSCCLFLYIESMENKAIQIPKPMNLYPSTRFSHLQRLSRIFYSVSSSSSSSSWDCTHSKCCIFRLDRVVVICRHRPETAIAGVWEVGHRWAKPEGAAP